MYSSIPFSSSSIDWTRLNYFNSYPFIQDLYTKPLENYNGDVNVTILAAQLDLDALEIKKRRKRKPFYHSSPKLSSLKPNPWIPSTYLSMEDVSDSEIQSQRESLLNETQKDATLSTIDKQEEPQVLSLNESKTIQHVEELKREDEIEQNEMNIKYTLQLKMKQSRLLNHCLKKWHHRLLSFFQLLHQCQIFREWKIKQIFLHHWFLKFRKLKTQREEKNYQMQLALDQARSKEAEMFNYTKRVSKCWQAWLVYVENEKFTRQLQDRYVHLQLEKEKSKTKEKSGSNTTNALSNVVVDTKTKIKKKDSVVHSLHPQSLKQSSKSILTQVNSRNLNSSSQKPTLSPPIPPLFLQRMQEREELRKQRKLERLKRKEEVETQKELQRIEKERLATLQEEKWKQEKKQKEKEAKEAKERWKHYCIQRKERALVFNSNRQMKQALQKWKRIKIKNEKTVQLADKMYLTQLWKRFKKNYLLFLSNSQQEALQFRNALLKKWCFGTLKKTFKKYQIKLNEAEAFHEHHCLKLISLWKNRAKVSAMRSVEKLKKDLEKADQFAVKVLLRWYFYEWRMNIKLIKDERWREYRKNLLRKKLREWLVDSSLEKLCNSTSIGTCFLSNSNEESNKNTVSELVQEDHATEQAPEQLKTN